MCIPLLWLTLLGSLSINANWGEAEPALLVGFGSCDITPAVAPDHPVWLAGYTPGRRATGIHDPIYARCCLLQNGENKMAFVSADLVGLQLPVTQRVRQQLADYQYVMLSSTHNHEGPDVIGVWGKSLFHRGVDESYLERILATIVSMVREVESDMKPAVAAYGTAEDESLLDDSRMPHIKDGVLRALRFDNPADGRTRGVLVQWNCHPEALGSRNTLITADFPAATVTSLEQRWGCPVAYFSGALGGLMAPPRNRILDEDGQSLGSGDFEFSRRYGEAVAELATVALERATPITLTPFGSRVKTILVPVDNAWYRMARVVGVLRRQARVWTGDFERPGEAVTLENAGEKTGVLTEVAYLRLGELDVACIPGEIYPELVYGKIEDPADPAADYAEAPCEPSVVETLPGDKWLLFGLANDEIGYILPKRQWDNKLPFAYGRSTPQYGEINSCGPQTGPIIMQALVNRVREARAGLTRESPER